jgi:ribosomal protein S18 acetylase RimI-like enzyme
LHIQPVQSVNEEIYQAILELTPLVTSKPVPSWRDLEDLVQSPGSILLFARYPDHDSSIVGMATLCLLRSPSGLHAHLEDVIVLPALRGQGIGESLTREVIRLAREAGADEIGLTSNPRREAANRLYQRIGFSQHETNVYLMKLK